MVGWLDVATDKVDQNQHKKSLVDVIVCMCVSLLNDPVQGITTRS